MCEICEHPSESNNIDDLLEAYERQQQEAHINKTIPVIDELSDIAYRLADAYEREYRANPIYENEERMRYWRYMGAEHWYSKSDGLYYTPYREYEQRKKEYDELVNRHAELVNRHAEAIEHTNDAEHNRHKEPKARNKKNIPAFAGLLGLTIGINVLVHIIFTLAS